MPWRLLDAEGGAQHWVVPHPNSRANATWHGGAAWENKVSFLNPWGLS